MSELEDHNLRTTACRADMRPLSPWLAKLVQRRPTKVAAVALANKIANLEVYGDAIRP